MLRKLTLFFCLFALPLLFVFVWFFLSSPVALSHALQFVLLLDGVAVAAALGGVDELLGQALGHRLDVAERRLARANRQQRNGLVHAAQRRHVDRLPAHRARRADARAVLARAAVDNGVDGHLDGVLVRHDVDLWNLPQISQKSEIIEIIK